MSFACFMAMGIDKLKARAGKWRIPERTLFLLAAMGGALGGIAAGLLLRRLSAVWLHRALGALIVWGGLRLLLR